MESLLEFTTKFGLGFAAALVLIVVVLAALKKFLPNSKILNDSNGLSQENLEQALQPINQKLDTLYEWHNVTDEDGVKLWYVRRSLDTAILKLSDAIIELGHSVKEIAIIQREMKKDLDGVQDDMADLKSEIINIRARQNK